MDGAVCDQKYGVWNVRTDYLQCIMDKYMYRNEALNLLKIHLISYYEYEELMDIYGISTMIWVKYDGNISSFRSTNHDVLPVPCRSFG